MVSTFKAVNAQGYQQIMGRFSTQLASSFWITSAVSPDRLFLIWDVVRGA